MCTHSTVNLGFAEVPISPGTHICQIYTDEEERDASLYQFLRQGVVDGERCACFSDVVTEERIWAYLRGHGVDPEGVRSKDLISVSTISDVYFAGGAFDPERMLGLLRAFEEKAKADGLPAARVIGEMSPEIHEIPGGSRLMEYESRVSLLLREHPVTAVCQYDAKAFDGATVMDVLKVHPMMIVRGAVVKNPFFVPPEEFLAAQGA